MLALTKGTSRCMLHKFHIRTMVTEAISSDAEVKDLLLSTMGEQIL